MSEYDDYPTGEAPDEFDEIGPSTPVRDREETIAEGDLSQHLLLSYLTTNPLLWSKCSPIVKETYFSDDMRKVVRYIREFEHKYKRLPSNKIIRADTGILLDTLDDATDPGIFAYVCDQVEEFCRQQAFIDLLMRASETIDTDRSRTTVAKFQKEAEQVARISVAQDLGYEVHENVQDVLKRAETQDGISTGLEFLDRALDGGVTMPSFNLVSASSGDGKSIWLQNMAVNYARMGYNVVFYTLELEPATIMKRFAAMMTDTDIRYVYRELDAIAFKMHTQGKTEGNIWLKKLPMTGTTMADIRAHHNDLRIATGKDWPVVCIDYMDVMHPVQTGIKLDNIHIKDQYVATEMNDFAHDPMFQKIVWSASQQVKGAQDDKDAKQSGVSGGAPKVNTVDNLLIIKRTNEDRQEEQAWVHIEKGRSSNAKGMKLPIHWNARTQRQTNGSEELFAEANPFFMRLHGQETRDTNRVTRDPIAREQGVEFTAPERGPSGRDRSGEAIRSRLSRTFGQQNRI